MSRNSCPVIGARFTGPFFKSYEPTNDQNGVWLPVDLEVELQLLARHLQFRRMAERGLDVVEVWRWGVE